MQVLLDECLPTVLRHELTDHDVRSVKHLGWAGFKNGESLTRMIEAGFEVFVTGDRNLRFQQNLRAVGVAVIELAAATNRLESLLPLMPQLRTTLDRIKPGDVIVLAA